MESRNQNDSHNVPLKVISLILGITFWYICNTYHTTTAWITVPLCFYNTSETFHIKAPENVVVKISGKRTELRNFDTSELAIHVNAAELREGKNSLNITPEIFFLPETIKLVHYSPIHPTVELIQK